jgi:hypothetical protein
LRSAQWRADAWIGSALVVKVDHHAGWSLSDYKAFRARGWTDEKILRQKIRHAAILVFSSSEWQILEKEFQKYGATPSMVTEEREKTKKVWSKTKLWHPYSEEITRLEESFNAKRQLIEEEWNRVLKQKYEVVPEQLAQLRDLLAAVREHTLRLSFENRTLEAAAYEFKMASKVEQFINQNPELKQNLDKFLEKSREKIKASTGIDIAAKDFNIEKLESHLRKDLQDILQRTDAMSTLRQLQLARRKAQYYIMRKNGFPLAIKRWLARHVMTATFVALGAAGMWAYGAYRRRRQREDYFQQLYKKHPEYVQGLVMNEPST